MQNMDEDQNTISSCTLLMDLYCNAFCDVIALRDCCYLQYVYSSKRRKCKNLKHLFVAFPRAPNAIIHNVRSLSCCANRRSSYKSRKHCTLQFFWLFKSQNRVVDRIRSISRTANAVICIRPSFSKPPNATFCSTRNLPRAHPRTRGPRDNDQGTPNPKLKSATALNP